MEIQPEEHDVHAPSHGRKWFASEGIGKRGQGVTLNFFVEEESDISPLAHGLGIASNIHMHKKAEYIGMKDDYLDMTKGPHEE